MRCEVCGQDEKLREVLIFSIFSYIYQLFGGLAHPDSYREVRACDWHFFKFFIMGGFSSVGRACDWQSQGQGFDSTNLHFLIVQLFVCTALVSAVLQNKEIRVYTSCRISICCLHVAHCCG